MAVRPIPEGHHTVTPYLVVRNIPRFIDFLKQAFGAEEVGRFAGQDGRVVHAEVRIGDSFVMMGEPMGDMKEIPAMIHLYVPDADATYRSALQAGATPLREVATQFYGDRSGGVKDSFGNQWWIATHVEDVSGEEMERRFAEMTRQAEEAPAR